MSHRKVALWMPSVRRRSCHVHRRACNKRRNAVQVCQRAKRATHAMLSTNWSKALWSSAVGSPTRRRNMPESCQTRPESGSVQATKTQRSGLRIASSGKWWSSSHRLACGAHSFDAKSFAGPFDRQPIDGGERSRAGEF